MKCKNTDMGTFDCHVSIQCDLPYNDPAQSDKRKDIIFVDKCIAHEIEYLLSVGIITGSCCCGHKTLNPTIAVHDCSIEKMKELGYELDLEYPNNKHIFKAKTKVAWMK